MTKLTVKVFPNSKRNMIEGFQNGVLKVRIHASPDKGKANQELIAFLAKSFQVSQNQIRIVSGHSSHLKRIEIQGLLCKDLIFKEDQ